jgi:hypothetical protein
LVDERRINSLDDEAWQCGAAAATQFGDFSDAFA